MSMDEAQAPVAAQHQQLEALRAQLRQLQAKCHRLESRLIQTRTSTTYQLGYQLRLGVTSVRGLLQLPVALFKLYRAASARRKARAPQVIPPTALASPDLVVHPPTPAPRPLPQAEYLRSQLMIPPQERANSVKIACVLDTFSYEAFRYESELLQLTPEQALAELHAFQPDLLFVESAWCGKDDRWTRKIAPNCQELRDVLTWCRTHQVPTVFWNKEDPVHFETFLGTAKQFDIVFTTDIDCIARYKSALAHERVYLLPFACQPAVHNPIELFERKEAFCFAGSYYARYPERSRDLAHLASALSAWRPLEIYDRNGGKTALDYQFPPAYRGCIVGTLDAAETDLAYKGYRYALNLNSIKHSQSMFARRVFELLGSNTLTVSNFSRGLRMLLGDLVVCSDHGEEVLRRLDSPAAHAKWRLLGLRKVMQEHTYAHRLNYVLSKAKGHAQEVPLPSICLFATAADDAQMHALAQHLQRQRYPHVRLCVVKAAGVRGPIVADSRIQLIDCKRLGGLTLGELAGDAAWFGVLRAEDYYGPHYLLDLALATRYSQARVIGKRAHYAAHAHDIQLQNAGQEYRCCPGMAARRALIKTCVLAHQPARDCLENLASLTFTHPQSLALDPFNYCENAAHCDQQQVQAVVDDVALFTGVDWPGLVRSSEALGPQQAPVTCPQISGAALAKLFGPVRSKHLNVQVVEEGWHLRATLADGQHEYCYARQDWSIDVLEDRSTLRLLLDATPGLHLQWVVLFLDAHKQRISHVMQLANRNQAWEVPPEAAYLRLGLRVYGSGSTTIKALIKGHRDTPPSTLLAKAQHLLLTNHYPAYDDLYRNGFIHTRVMAYRARGLEMDVFRLRLNQALDFQEFENIDVTTGPPTALANLLGSGCYRSVLVHFLDAPMWEVLRPFLPTLQVIVWVHGAEIQPWWRRAYNYSDAQQLQLAKLDSDQRLGFWRGVLQPMPANLQLVFVSRQFADEVMQDLGFELPQEHYRIIHNPIDTRLFSFQEKPPQQRRKILSIRPYVSRTYANDLSVKAIQLLASKPWFNQLEFLMVGDGPLFEETLAPLRHYPNVKIEKRYLKQADIARLHKDYGVFLCPSRMDTQGVSRDEAMASGLVPVTSRVGAIAEFVDDRCGFLCTAESFSELAEAIEALFLNPALFTQKSLNARQRVCLQRDMHPVCTSELSLIREALP
ncbi:glycosyltransferase [Pseudomonas kairouanensis]|nr:glycosyltransferase [Pseudomonas kairouanensis]